MIKTIIAIVCCVAMACMPAGAVNKNKSSNTAQKSHSAAPADEEMTYASISKSNPFEIVPAAGMELVDDLRDSDVAEMVSDLLSYAKRYLGTRYLRGGKTPKGFDCSGFTSYVFNQFGISLSTSSSGQYAQGSKIAKDEIEAGDLLFFTGRNSRSGSVGHVGIAVDHDPATGEITFIHAARTGIKVDKMSAPYYKARYLGARRVL